MGWAKWADLGGGGFQGAPAAWTLQGVTHVVARGNGNEVLTRTSSDGATFSGWTSIPGGTITSSPTLFGTASSLYLAAKGTDGMAYVARYLNGAWTAFQRFGGPIDGEVSLVTTRVRISTVLSSPRYQTTLHLFAWSPDRRILWGRDGGSTGGILPFAPIGGDMALSAAPAVYGLDDGTLVLAGTSTTGQVWWRTFSTAGSWGPWQLGYKSTLLGAVNVRRLDGALSMVGRGSENHVHYWEGGTHLVVTNQNNPSPSIAAPPVIDSRGPGHRQVFGRSAAGSLVWSQSVGAPTADVVVVVDPPVLPMPSGI